MSNSFTSPGLLVDPARLTSGLTIRSDELERIGDMQNYAFAVGGCGNVLAQAWDSDVFKFTSTSMTDVCEWFVPVPSEEHQELVFRLSSFSALSGSQAKVTITFPTSSNTYSTTVTITDSSRYNSVFDVITVSITGAEQDQFAKVTLSLQAAAGSTVEVSGIQASWTKLSSPLASRSLGQHGSDFIPAGQNRLGADNALSSRFGVNSLSNIDLLRQRRRTLLAWSGVSSSSTSPAQGLGTLDSQILFSLAALPAGINNIGLNIVVYIKAANIGGSPLNIDIFGHSISVSVNGWSAHELDLRLQESTQSDQFGLSVYRVGLDESLNNQSNLLSTSNPISSTPPFILGLCILGV